MGHLRVISKGKESKGAETALSHSEVATVVEEKGSLENSVSPAISAMQQKDDKVVESAEGSPVAMAVPYDSCPFLSAKGILREGSAPLELRNKYMQQKQQQL